MQYKQDRTLDPQLMAVILLRAYIPAAASAGWTKFHIHDINDTLHPSRIRCTRSEGVPNRLRSQ
jgi:hypothetical protein